MREALKSRARVKVLYAETYRAHSAKIRSHVLPTLPSASAGFSVHSAFLMKAGRAELDGETLEFQDVRIYLREATEATDATKGDAA